MKNKRCLEKKTIKIFESFFFKFFFVVVTKTNGLKFRHRKKWTEKKGGALDRVQSSRTRTLTKSMNFFFLMSNKLLNNTPPCTPEKKREKKDCK